MSRYKRLYLLGGLMLLALPFLLLGFYSYRELIVKQEKQLKKGYEHSAEYIQYNLASSLHEMKHHLIFIGKNPVLQAVLTGKVEQATRIPSLLNTSIEPYLWYHSTSNRSMMRSIVIYADVPLPIGRFLQPLANIRHQIPNDFWKAAESGRLISIDGAWYYGYRFFQVNGTKPLGMILGRVDIDRLIGGAIREEKDIGISLSFGGQVVYKSDKDDEGASLDVIHTDETTGLTLHMRIPSQNVHMETAPLVIATIISLGILTLMYALLAWSVRQLERQVEQERNQRERMRLKAMQAQINPHFLYNTLSMINWKAKYANVPDISKITTLISDFYRTALNKGEDQIKLSEELRNVEAYLELKSVMMEGCFIYEIHCDKELGDCRIVNFILQPLVENALIHAIAPQGGGKIIISAERDDGDIVLSVQDNGPGMCVQAENARQNAQGYGIKNIHERIQLLCGPGYGVRNVPCQTGTRMEIRVKMSCS